MKHIILFTLLFFINNVSQAEVLKNKAEAKQLIKTVMKHIKTGKLEKGLSYTKPYLIIPSHEYDGLINSLRMQAPMIKQRFGESIGAELIKTEEVGESLMLIVYIQKFEKHLMRWKFYFYKSKNGWVLNTFNTDDKIKGMFNH